MESFPPVGWHCKQTSPLGEQDRLIHYNAALFADRILAAKTGFRPTGKEFIVDGGDA